MPTCDRYVDLAFCPPQVGVRFFAWSIGVLTGELRTLYAASAQYGDDPRSSMR
jgi:hypothetical protein